MLRLYGLLLSLLSATAATAQITDETPPEQAPLKEAPAPRTASTTDLTKYTRSIIQSSSGAGGGTVVGWIPNEYWAQVLRSGGYGDEQIAQVSDVLRPYAIFLAAQYAVTPGAGTMLVTDSATLSKNTHIRTAEGRELARLAPAEVPAFVQKAVYQSLRPTLANFIGKLGAGVQLFIYPNPVRNGAPMFSALTAGGLSIQVFDKTFYYKMPLPAFLPAKKCPVDGAEMAGDWHYCPYHGKALP